MTGSQRQHLKQLIDHHRRLKVEEEDRPFKVARCKGCGGEQQHITSGCQTCHDRHQKWRKKQDPEWVERHREYNRIRAARRRASLQGRPAGSSPDGCQPSEKTCRPSTSRSKVQGG